MRHKKLGRRFSRDSSHRQAMFSNMAASLIRHEQIVTTLAKAKDLKRVIDKYITLAKRGDLNSRRLAASRLRDEDMAKKLFDTLAPRYKDRAGGYSRVLKAGFRYGDSAPRAVIELVDRDTSIKGKEDRERHEAAVAQAQSEFVIARPCLPHWPNRELTAKHSFASAGRHGAQAESAHVRAAPSAALGGEWRMRWRARRFWSRGFRLHRQALHRRAAAPGLSACRRRCATSAREEETRRAIGNAGATASEVKFFPADLLSDDGWDKAMEGCTYVLHVASPFPIKNPNDPDEVIRPAREGAVRVLKAAAKAGREARRADLLDRRHHAALAGGAARARVR